MDFVLILRVSHSNSRSNFVFSVDLYAPVQARAAFRCILFSLFMWMKSAELNITSPYPKFGRRKVLYSCSLVSLGILFSLAFSIPCFLFAFVESSEMVLAQDIWLLIVNPRIVCSDTSSNNILSNVIYIFVCESFLFVTSLNLY